MGARAVRRTPRAAIAPVLFGLALLIGVAATPIPTLAALPASGLADLVETLMPTVVNITVRTIVRPPTSGLNAAAQPGPDSGLSAEMRAKTTLGSGFVIDPSGIIVTNNHVIDGAFDVSVTFHDGAIAHAVVLATTKIGDLALLKVNMDRPLPAAHFGDSSKMRVGETVITVGNPLGFGGTVSTGIVSALNRDIMLSPFDDFIQTDAALNHGNSGGPMFNLNGDVIGVNTALFTPTDNGGSVGIGFAIPAYCVQFVVGQLLQYGFVRAGEIGVRLQDVTSDIAQAAGVPPTAHSAKALPGSAGWGVILTDLTPDGPAARAGLQDGDIVLRVDNRAIGDTREFARLIAIHPLDEKVTLGYWREGQMAVAQPVVREWVTAEQTDRAALARSSTPRSTTMDLGLRLALLSADARTAHHLPPDLEGVLITGVMPDSAAGDRGLGKGDVILKVMNKPVQTPDDVLAGLRVAIAGQQSMALVLVRGAAGLRWVPLPIQARVN